MANKAKNNATGNIPITVHAVSLAFSHSVEPKAASEGIASPGHVIASETSLKISIPMSKATAAPMKASIKPNERTINN